MPETEANPKPANEAMSRPNPIAKARRAATVRDARTRAPREAGTPRTTPGGKAGGPRHNENAEHRRPGQTGFALSFDSGPDSFRAVAGPLPAATGGEAVSYRFIVGGMLERVKHYPETARQRAAKGIAIIGFVFNELGRIAAVSVLRSSGEADLEAECVALVNRAAPLPPPPPGAQDFHCGRSCLRHGKLSSAFYQRLEERDRPRLLRQPRHLSVRSAHWQRARPEWNIEEKFTAGRGKILVRRSIGNSFRKPY